MMDLGSFRDPSGKVFISEGRIYRSILPPGVEDFNAARQTGIFERLIRDDLLIDYRETEIPVVAPKGTVYCLNHPRLPFISYPWEWSFSMLKDAALLHLEIMEKLLPEGFWLRDASAFNVQFDGSRSRFIDILSIGKRIPESPWVAYGQFCSHFLAPLSMAAHGDIRMMGLWRNTIDGFPLDLALAFLPLRKYFNPGFLMHLILHARFQKRALKRENLGFVASKNKPKVSDAGLIALMHSLKRTISNIAWKPSSGLWMDYETFRIYDPEDVRNKSNFLIRVLQKINPEIVWDLGANTGEFSRLATMQGAYVVGIEQDPACAEQIYKDIRCNGFKERILPLTMDLANPSPSLGFNGEERLSLKDRGPADLIMALALVHHLVLSSYIPLQRISKWFFDIAKNLIVEFVPPEDPMVLKLLSNRSTGHLPYDFNTFREGIASYFEMKEELRLKNGRILIWCHRR